MNGEYITATDHAMLPVASVLKRLVPKATNIHPTRVFMRRCCDALDLSYFNNQIYTVELTDIYQMRGLIYGKQ